MTNTMQPTIISMEQREVAEVAEQFVLCYYKMMHDSPQDLHRFYQNNSSMIYEDSPVFGQKSIHEKFRQLNLSSISKVTVHVLQLDALKAHDKIVIQVAGEIKSDKADWRRFMQTFVLGEVSANNFFVMTDIFRFQDRVFPDAVVPMEAPIKAPVEPKVAVERPQQKETPPKISRQPAPAAVVVQHHNGIDHAVTEVIHNPPMQEVKPTTPVKEKPVEPQAPKSWAQMVSNGANNRPRPPVDTQPQQQQQLNNHENNNDNSQPVPRATERGGYGRGSRYGGGGGRGGYTDREQQEPRGEGSARMRGGGGGPRNTHRGGAITVGGAGNRRN